MSQQRASVQEHFWFESAGCRLAAALHIPSGERKPVALVLLHGWAGYRVGAHQMFVKLAREAVARGFVCLRFDFRGRGDSEGEASATTLTTMIEDTQAACAELRARLGIQRFALIGDCSGSEVTIGAGPLMDGCAAWVLWSAPLVGASREAMDRAKHRSILRQYAAKLLRPETWSKLLSGRLQIDMIRRAILGGGKGAGEKGSASDKDIDWLGRFHSFKGPVLFIYGSADPTTAESVAHFERLTRKAGRTWHLYLVEGANHAFYSVKWEREVIDQTLDWLEREV